MSINDTIGGLLLWLIFLAVLVMLFVAAYLDEKLEEYKKWVT